MTKKTGDHYKDACATFLEATKLLTALATGMVLAPAAAAKFLWEEAPPGNEYLFYISESVFIASVLFGYIVFGSIAGSQDDNDYDVYRGATRWFSILQILCLVGGLACLLIYIGNPGKINSTSKLTATEKVIVNDLRHEAIHELAEISETTSYPSSLTEQSSVNKVRKLVLEAKKDEENKKLPQAKKKFRKAISKSNELLTKGVLSKPKSQ